MVWGAIAAAAIPAAMSYLGGKEANAANARMASQQMDFQENMRATQYQTTVADLKAAGLNPMLAYTNGGAGTPQGATAQMENVMGRVGQSAKEGALAYQQYENMKMQNFATEQQGENSAAQALLAKDTAAKTRMETVSELLKQSGYKLSGEQVMALINQLNASAKASSAQAGLYAAQEANTRAIAPAAKAEGDAYRDEPGDFISGQLMKQIEKLTGSARSAINAIRGN
jgi:hypothetical protein